MSDIDIPLPHFVSTTKEELSDMTNLQYLFYSDYKEHNRNLIKLEVSDITSQTYRKNIAYIEELKAPVKQEVDLKGIAALMSSVKIV